MAAKKKNVVGRIIIRDQDISALIAQFPDKLDRAINLAQTAHAGQKYGEDEYTEHLDDVVHVVRYFGETYMLVAMLHDILEDTTVTYAQLERAFGYHIAQNVQAVTDPPGTMSRGARKKAVNAKLGAIKAFEDGLDEALVVKAADRLANVYRCVEMKDASRLNMYASEHADFVKAVLRYDLNHGIFEALDRLWKR